MKSRVLQIALIGFALVVGIAPLTNAFAATVTTTLPISLTVTAGCSVQATGVNFGSVTAGNGATSTGTITVNCVSGTPYTVTLDGGTHVSIASVRALGGGSAYELYKDSAMTQIWGDSGFGNTYNLGAGVGGTGTGADQTLTVFGKIINVGNSVGTFTDNVVVTVNF